MMFVTRTPEAYKNCLQHISNLPTHKIFDVSIDEHKSTRSVQQNRFYWAIIKIMADHVGMGKEDMHRTFAIRLLEPDLFVVDGKQYVGAKSTTKLTTKEFTDYLNGIQAVALQMNVILPTPKTFGYDWK